MAWYKGVVQDLLGWGCRFTDVLGPWVHGIAIACSGISCAVLMKRWNWIRLSRGRLKGILRPISLF
jgi:hypothetical protein